MRGLERQVGPKIKNCVLVETKKGHTSEGGGTKGIAGGAHLGGCWEAGGTTGGEKAR